MKFGTSRRTFEFTVEKSESFTIQRPRKIFVRWCGDCQSEVEMSSPEDAARMTGVSTRKIYSQIEIGRTHFTESNHGSLLVCHQSIEQCRELSEGEEIHHEKES